MWRGGWDAGGKGIRSHRCRGCAIRVVLGLGDSAGGGKGGGVGVGGEGGDCTSGMDGSQIIMRRYPERGSVYFSGGFQYLVGRISKREREYTDMPKP